MAKKKKITKTYLKFTYMQRHGVVLVIDAEDGARTYQVNPCISVRRFKEYFKDKMEDFDGIYMCFLTVANNRFSMKPEVLEMVSKIAMSARVRNAKHPV